MITLKTLEWSNAFSYGANNSIDLSDAQLTQLVGKNGHGKSSIAIILEEVLFNKNSKGIKKGDILNRYISDKFWTASLTLDKDGIDYRIETKRGSTQTVKLFKNGQDISGHTPTTTYKLIEDLIGMDHKTFAQIVYQSHAGALEFLTSPDTARKKFLIELLNLSKYTKAGELFKTTVTDTTKEVAVLQSKVDTIKQWINKYKDFDFSLKTLYPVPDTPDLEIAEAQKLSSELQNLDSTNKKIAQNNTYRQLQNAIEVLPAYPRPTESLSIYIDNKAKYNATATAASTLKQKMSKLGGQCPTCYQDTDHAKTHAIIEQQAAIIEEANSNSAKEELEIRRITALITQWETSVKSQDNWEKYHQLIDDSLPSEPVNAQELQAKLAVLRSTIATRKTEIDLINSKNKVLSEHNSKVAIVEGQLVEMRTELAEWEAKLSVANAKLSIRSILAKTFSTTGLVAYKIENLVKDLEEISNDYLGELSGGRFQLGFEISGSDKLNVVITDNNNNIDINALSGGERARVNVATLLAIRKLMQALSQSRINLLILDETVESLDVDGKEKLIEVLLGEESLNTILVSHGFSHPLLEKVHVVKSNNISRIEG